MSPLRFVSTLPLRLRSLFRRARVEQELDQELAFHLERRIDELKEQGMEAGKARTTALREMGGVEQRKEECRDARRTRPVEDFCRDILYGLRMLRRQPGFTSIVIIALALGIGANTAVFSLFREVLLRNLPVANPEELVMIETIDSRGNDRDDFSFPMFRALRDNNTVLAGLFAIAQVEMNVGRAGQSNRAVGRLVTGDYFETLGVKPARGRFLTPDDDRTPGAHPVAVLDYNYWQTQFGGDEAVLGAPITLNGQPFTVVGIAPRTFFGVSVGSRPDIYVPMTMVLVFRPIPTNRLENPKHSWLSMMGRARKGLSREQAESGLALLHRQILLGEAPTLGRMTEHNREIYLSQQLKLKPGGRGTDYLRNRIEKALSLLLVISGVILVITCANVANMLSARNAAREAEVGMRFALGAGRWRLVRQWLTESLLLSVLGGAAGIMVAFWTSGALLSFLPKEQQENLRGSLDFEVLGFALLVSMICGLVFGSLPAWQVSRLVQHGARGEGRVARGLRGSLVALQVALCVPLLIVAGLFLHSLRNTRLVPVGFEGSNVVLASLNPSLNAFPQPRVKQFYDEFLSQVRALPGVEAVGYAVGIVLSGGWDQLTVRVEGYTPREDEGMTPYANTISPGYFDVLRLPIVAGRDFSERDAANAPKVAIINETMARYFFGTSNPLGKKIGLSSDGPPDMEIIGVVKDAKYVSVREEPVRHFYMPMAQQENLFDMTLHVRGRGESRSLIQQLRRQAQELDPNVPLYDVKLLETTMNESLTQDRLVTWLSGALAGLATLLAALGLYGVIAFSVTRRTREIGIRMALGAKRLDVLGLVVKQVATLVLIGLVAGLALAWSGSRFVQAILYEVRSTDPAAFLGAILMFLFAAAAAAFFPARKAVRVEPSTALRYE